MHKLSNLLFALALILSAPLVRAQTAGTITLTANPASGTGSVTPVLTWSTSPVASGCVASGGWSGTKFASGSETVAATTASKSYTLTCSWGNGSATLSWATPTQNTDGSALTNLAAFKVLFGNSASALSQITMVNDPKATGTTVAALGSGTWYFAVRAVTAQQLESANSNVVSKTISAASAAKTVNVTVTAASPPPPTLKLKTISTRAFDVLTQSDGSRLLGRQVGTIALGRPCGETYKVGADYYRVNKDYVTFTRTPRSTYVVVRCARS